MSCFYNVSQFKDAAVRYVDPFEAVSQALNEDIQSGRVVIDPSVSGRSVVVFCTEVDVTEMPSDVSDKLKEAWFSAHEGPYDVQTERRVLEPIDYWRERNAHLVC